MALFTEQLKYVIEDLFGETMDPFDFEQSYHEVEYEGIKYGKLPFVPDWTKLGLGTYPLFDENYRDILNGKIVDEYFNREIGAETIDDWQLMVRRRMDQVMPVYNKLYESEKIKFDPLATYDLTTETESNTDQTSDTNSSSNTNSGTTAGSRAVSQEMPQTMLAGNGDYATSAADTNSETNVSGETVQEGNSSNNTKNDGTSHTKGFQGVASDLLIRYRNSIINIDRMILSELEDCFMLVLNNGDSYTQREWWW